jgi:hypothetical protein
MALSFSSVACSYPKWPSSVRARAVIRDREHHFGLSFERSILMRRLFELMIVVVIVGAGCSMTGRQLAAHYDSGPLLGNSGHHNLYYEHLIVEFDYKIDRSMNTITCDGVIGFRNIHQGFPVKGLHLMAVFLDSNRVIIDTQDFFLTNLDTREKTPFKKTLSYKSSYKEIAFGYSFQY